MVLGAERSSMIPALNAVNAKGVEDIFRLTDFARGMLPHHLWHSVMHELAHHWTFQTPVGAALNLLYVEQCRRLLKAVDEERSVDALLAHARRAIFVNDIALGCLEPMGEAIALFVEHDLAPSNQSIESIVLKWARILFTDVTELPERNPMEESDRRLRQFLLEARLSVKGVDRKANLLAHRFADTQAYLGGYLLLRATQRAKTQEDIRIAQSDALVMLVRELFFGDYALVDVLLDALDSQSDPYYLSGRITQTVVHRLRELLAGDLPAMLDQVLDPDGNRGAAPLSSGYPGRLEDGSSLERRWWSGLERLEAQVGASHSEDDDFSQLAALSFQHREIFVLYRSRFPCITRNGLVQADTTEPKEFPLITAANAGLPPDGAKARAMHEVIIYPFRGDVVSVYNLNGRLVDWFPLRVADGMRSGLVHRTVGSRTTAVQAQSQLLDTWTNLRALLKRDIEASAHLNAARKVANDFYRKNFLHLAMLLLGSGDEQKARRMLAEEDLVGAIGSADTVRQVAALSLLAEMYVGREDISTVLSAVGLQYGQRWDLASLERHLLVNERRLLGERIVSWLGDDLLVPWV